MWFADPPHWLPDPPPVAQGRLRMLHMVSCLLTIALGALPWNEIAYPRLWGPDSGPLGWNTTPGAMSAMAALMVLGLTLIEGRSETSREATRPGILMLSWVGAAPMLWRLWDGPGSLRGVSAAHTMAFWLAVLASLSSAILASRRLAVPSASVE